MSRRVNDHYGPEIRLLIDDDSARRFARTIITCNVCSKCGSLVYTKDTHTDFHKKIEEIDGLASYNRLIG